MSGGGGLRWLLLGQPRGMTNSETHPDIATPRDTATLAATYFRAWEAKDVIHKAFVDGPDVVTWFDSHTTTAPPVPTANWSRVENGRITAIRVAFDARAFIPPTGS